MNEIFSFAQIHVRLAYLFFTVRLGHRNTLYHFIQMFDGNIAGSRVHIKSGIVTRMRFRTLYEYVECTITSIFGSLGFG